MKKIIILLFLGIFTAFPARASKIEKAEELLKLINFDSVLDLTYEQAMLPILCTVVMSTEEQAMLKQEFEEILDAPALSKVFMQFWVDHFTEEELGQLLAFYKTTVGKKTLQLMPQYAQFSMIELQKWMQERTKKFFELGQKIDAKYPKRSGMEAEACIKEKMGM